MSNLQALETQGQRTDGEIRFLALPVRTALAVQRADSLLPQASTGTPGSAGGSREVAKQMTETTLVLTIRHSVPLPDLFKDKTTAYAYDYLMARNVRADVDGKVWYEVAVKEEA